MCLTTQVRRFLWGCVLIMGACCTFSATWAAQDPQQQAEDKKATDQDPAVTKQETPAQSDPDQADAADEAKAPPSFPVKVAKGSIEFTASGSWKQVPPKSGMIEAEIKISKLGEDKEDGRLTIMGAGGTIEANITRWQGQFAKEDGELPEVKTEVKKIADQEVHFVDISGTYLDMPGGPFAGGSTIEREGYRMLAAIVKTDKHGNYFVKLYGPEHTIEQNQDHFKSMIESLKVHAGEEADKD